MPMILGQPNPADAALLRSLADAVDRGDVTSFEVARIVQASGGHRYMIEVTLLSPKPTI